MKYSIITAFTIVAGTGTSNAERSSQKHLRVLSDEQASTADLQGDSSMSYLSSAIKTDGIARPAIAGIGTHLSSKSSKSKSKSDKSSKSGKSIKCEEPGGEEPGGQCKQFKGADAPNNGAGGNMFKIEASQDIVINGFTLFAYGDFDTDRRRLMEDGISTNVTIWDKCGDYVGFDSNETAWNKIQDTVVENVTMGMLFVLPKLENPIFISKGSFRSFHIYSKGADLGYMDGDFFKLTEGDRYDGVYGDRSNGTDIFLYNGLGCFGVPFDCDFSPRVWIGLIDYCVGPPSESSGIVEDTCPPPSSEVSANAAIPGVASDKEIEDVKVKDGSNPTGAPTKPSVEVIPETESPTMAPTRSDAPDIITPSFLCTFLGIGCE